MARELGFIEAWGEKIPIESIDIPRCAKCSCKITSENHSGWEVFISGRKTQAVCIECNKRYEESKGKHI